MPTLLSLISALVALMKKAPAISTEAHKAESEEALLVLLPQVIDTVVSTTDTSTDLEADPVAIELTSKTTKLVTTEDFSGEFTLADGIEGQTKRLVFVSKGDVVNAVVTPDHIFGYDIITFSNEGENVDLIFLNDEWYIVGTPTAVAS